MHGGGGGGKMPLTLCRRLLLGAAILERERPPPARPPPPQPGPARPRPAAGKAPAKARGTGTLGDLPGVTRSSWSRRSAGVSISYPWSSSV